MKLVDLKDTFFAVRMQRTQDRLRFKEVSAACTPPEAGKPGMDKHGQRAEPLIEIKLRYAKPMK